MQTFISLWRHVKVKLAIQMELNLIIVQHVVTSLMYSKHLKMDAQKNARR